MLHVVVGHKLPTYFLNAVRSVRRLAPGDDLLVIDNASDLPSLREALVRLQSEDSRLRVRLRDRNELSRNTKVGGLYDAYAEAMAHGLEQGYDLLHLLQADMQMVWWGEPLVQRALQLFGRFPTCINIHTSALPRDQRYSDATAATPDGDLEIVKYGLSDTGLYHLGRWREHGIRFLHSEQEHARVYRKRGHRVLCHPWPAVAPVPWPAVVRSGRVRGREVTPPHEFLIRPLGESEILRMQSSADHVWLEDVCVPWGWECLTPMWVSGLETIDYWVYRYRDARSNGLRAAMPRWDRRGVEAGGARRPQRRPPLWHVALFPPVNELRRRAGFR